MRKIYNESQFLELSEYLREIISKLQYQIELVLNYDLKTN